MRFAACHSCIHSSPTCLTCVRRFPAADSPRAGATRGAPGPGSEAGIVACPAPHHPCTLLHTCPPCLPHTNLHAFAPRRTPCPPSCTPHGHCTAALHSHTVCPLRPPENFHSVQGRSGAGRDGTRTGAHTFLPAQFHSVGICLLGAAGGLAPDPHAFRTAFLASFDRFRLGACSQARSACLRAMLPSQCTHPTSPHQHIPLSFCIGLSHASQLMHAGPYMHYTHFEHAISHALLTWV